jgi:hemerythrin-like domain-containing protein
MEDHAEIASMVRDVRSAAASGQAGVAKDICAKISSLFAVHSQLEEEGLFAELMSDPLATDAISELTTEHRSLQSGLAALASGAPDASLSTLDALVVHADREDTDVFPVALQILPNPAWERVKTVHQGFAADATHGRS